MTKTIKDWTASRSGAALTVYGKDMGGVSVRVPNVARVEVDPVRGEAVAITKEGERYHLLVPHPDYQGIPQLAGTPAG